MNSDQRTRHSRSWSEGWMRVFLETAVDAIVIIDAKGLIESFNPAAERMFGYRDVDVVGLNVSMLMPPPHADEHDGYLERFLRTQEKKIIGIGREVQGRRKDGTLFPLHLSVAELELDGEVRFTGMLRDLSSEKQAHARQADTARILETSINEIYVFDAKDLRFIHANDGARSNLGYSLEELAQLTPLDLKPELNRAAFQALLEPLRTGDLKRRVFTTLHRRKDRSTYPAEVHLQLSTFDGRSAFVAIVLDTTKRDQLQRELLHAQKMEAVGRLSGALAHDFNNLLMGVISGCRMVERMVDRDGPARDMLAEIQKEAQRGAGITRQLLDFSRKRVYETRACDLNAIVREAEGMFRKLMGNDVELTLSADAPDCTVLADPGKIEQILMNLVVNARDAMPSGGELAIAISVADRDAGPGVLVTVTDTGCGMDDETRAQAFEPFYTTKDVGQGTGLGLSTVFGLTQEFGGRVELESAPGKGTTFRLFFPRHEGEVIATDDEPTEAVPGGSGTILVVEDTTLVRAGIRSLLQERGYTVVDAAEPEAALELLADTPRVDLLLTDIMLPGMSGPELADAVRAARPSIPVLFMSAFSDENLIEQGRLPEGTTVLEKPFEEEELARRVHELLVQE